MNNIDRIMFLSKGESILGHSVIKEFNADQTQYFLETFVRNMDLGRNPNFINQSYYEGLRYNSNDFTDEEIDDLIDRELFIDSDIYSGETDRFVSVGMKYDLSDPSSAGIFYFFRVPYGTFKINAYYQSKLTATLILSTHALSDSMVMISSTNDDLVFGNGLITTRSDLIIKDESEINESGYIAGFQDFYVKMNPCYKEEARHFNGKEQSNSASIHLLGTDKRYVKSRGTEVNQYIKTYRKGDIKSFSNASFKCLVDGATEDFDNIEHWIQL